MYIPTLTLTEENILSFLLENLNEEYSIREIAKTIKQDYKIVFTSIQKLKGKNLIMVKRISNINSCTLNLDEENALLFSYISQKNSIKKLPKGVISIVQDITTSTKDPFYTLLIFGSYAKKTATQKSDLDLLFIISNRNQESDVMAAIKKASTFNNIKISPVILNIEEFRAGLKELSVAQEAYKKHFVIHGGEQFYEII